VVSCLNHGLGILIFLFRCFFFYCYLVLSPDFFSFCDTPPTKLSFSGFFFLPLFPSFFFCFFQISVDPQAIHLASLQYVDPLAFLFFFFRPIPSGFLISNSPSPVPPTNRETLRHCSFLSHQLFVNLFPLSVFLFLFLLFEIYPPRFVRYGLFPNFPRIDPAFPAKPRPVSPFPIPPPLVTFLVLSLRIEEGLFVVRRTKISPNES